MTTTTKGIIAVVGAVVLVLFVWGAYQYPKEVQLTAGSSAGSTFQSAKIAEVVSDATYTGASTTLGYVLNGDASDRVVIDAGAFCTGLASASSAVNIYNFRAGTSTNVFNIPSATNLAMNVTLASSTSQRYVATSTYLGSGIQQVWATGTYMVFTINATTSATCTPFVHYIAQ